MGGGGAAGGEESDPRVLLVQLTWRATSGPSAGRRRGRRTRHAARGGAPEPQTLCAMIEVYGALGDVVSAEEVMGRGGQPGYGEPLSWDAWAGRIW